MNNAQYNTKKRSGFAVAAMLLLAACGSSEDKPMKVPEGAVAGDLFMESCPHVLNGVNPPRALPLAAG